MVSGSSRPRVLAIGIDAAEPTLVRRLIGDGRLPSLRRLLLNGTWGDVSSPADIGSGAVWPTFITGNGPLDHGIYSILPWDPRAMCLVRLTTQHLTPFWERWRQQGHAIGILDVPFAPVKDAGHGIEISEWGAHDRMRGHLIVSPGHRHDWLTRTGKTHPLGHGTVEVAGPQDWKALHTLASECREGARLRGDLAMRLLTECSLDVLIAVFTEVHHASHYLWHTLEADVPSLIDVYGEVDRQIGRLLDLTGDEATVLVFSLHGMRGTRGIPMILDPLLRALALASPLRWRARTWPERGQWLSSTIKQASPNAMRRLYRRVRSGALRPPQQRVRLPYDWSKTVAFPVPTDQHGWIRLNVRGREAGGLVDRAHYDEVCTRLDQALRGLTTEQGSRIVENVIRVGGGAASPVSGLPDLVVHWGDEALADPLRTVTPSISARATGTKFTGQHAARGFFIHRPASGECTRAPAALAAHELHGLIQAGLGA